MAVFDNKIYNAEVFDAYRKTLPHLRSNELLKSGVFTDVTSSYKAKFAEQGGSNYVVETMKGRIAGDPVNYDGDTNITATSRDTYQQGKVVFGRAKGWTEKDFAYDITGGHNFDAVLGEIAEYWDDINQDVLLAILKGIFSMGDTEFTNDHTYDISAADTTDDADAQKYGAATLNTAMQKACGDKKAQFAVIIMHSAVATRLENLQLLTYMKYNDANGIERELPMATYNGKLVLIDDTMPVTGSGASAIYTSYVLGRGAFEYCDAGAKQPFETWRDPATNGGEDYLFTRERKMYAPMGISFEPVSIPKSPTNAQFEAGSSWRLARSSDGATDKFPAKAIPIARILAKV